MPKPDPHTLDGVARTLLIPLYTRALESQRPDAMLRDPRALEIVKRIDFDFEKIRLHGHDEVALILRVREFDRHAHQFLAAHPDGVVVHIGCGLDTRFERVDNGTVEWFDLDLPEVMALRETYIGRPQPRCHPLSASVFADEWLETALAFRPRPFLFLAEGVLPYFKEAQVKELVLKLKNLFPGAELVCDAQSPFVIWGDNLQLALLGLSARLHWGLKHPRDVEGWGDGIRLLEAWYYFDQPEPRMKAYRWMGSIPLLGKAAGIYHYRLG